MKSPQSALTRIPAPLLCLQAYPLSASRLNFSLNGPVASIGAPLSTLTRVFTLPSSTLSSTALPTFRSETVPDLQSKAFSCFLVLMLVPEFINAISMRFILNRDIWLAREGPSGVYGWVAFCTAQIISEIPYSVIGGVVFFVIYYFMVGLPLGFAAGYCFLMFFLFFLFATSWGQWIAALR